MIEQLSAVAVGAVLVALGRYVWRAIFPPPGRHLLTFEPADSCGLIAVVEPAPAVVHVIAETVARYYGTEHPDEPRPAAIVVEVMPRPQ